MASPTGSSPDQPKANVRRPSGPGLEGFFAETARVLAVEESPASPAGEWLPEGWRRLPTDRADTWLCEISAPARAGVCWEAGMTLGGKRLQRRFASELHARAWLAVTNEPREPAIPFELEEFRDAIRIAGVVGGSRVPF